MDSLPDYVPNEENPAEELLFGDPERIELKSMIREYRGIYPNKSYESKKVNDLGMRKGRGFYDK
ncbi:MAG: hypothetical protein SPF70_12115 [Lachnospiraceae bacterium]|nr:hypothetical protein [Lachnospiraceae bacterium]